MNSGILYGIDGYIIEIQARAINMLKRPREWGGVTQITGMAFGEVREAKSRIVGAFAKLDITKPEV